jgi:amidase
MITASGAPVYKDRVAGTDAAAVARLRAAGAVIFGKTNVPFFCGDFQSYNPVYGTTNNPWDATRSPGGSSGGAAAAVATGLSAFELGSDLGGSIRWPAHATGVFGLKTTWDLVSTWGHVPPPPERRIERNGELTVAGPLARRRARSWPRARRHRRPRAIPRRRPRPSRRRARHRPRACGWRCGSTRAWPPLTPRSPPAAAQGGGGFGGRRRDHRRDGAPALLDGRGPTRFTRCSTTPSSPQACPTRCATRSSPPPPACPGASFRIAPCRRAARAWRRTTSPTFRRGARRSSPAGRRSSTRRTCCCAPPAPVGAIPHDHNPDIHGRRLKVNDRDIPYLDFLVWSSLATGGNLPAAVAPILRAADGLPRGVQIIAGAFEDRTAIAVAHMLEESCGGFVAPPMAAA